MNIIWFASGAIASLIAFYLVAYPTLQKKSNQKAAKSYMEGFAAGTKAAQRFGIDVWLDHKTKDL